MSKISPGEDEMSLAETYLNFKIRVKRKEIQDFKNELNRLEEKKRVYTEMKERLREEQFCHVRAAVKEMQEHKRNLEQKEVLNREQVEQALRHNWDLASSQEKQLAELRSDLASLDEQLVAPRVEEEMWLDYKKAGCREYQQKICRLENDLASMQDMFHDMSGHIQWSLDRTLSEIDSRTALLKDERKHLATERAIKQLGPTSQQEVIENEWLKKEIDLYKTAVSTLEDEAQKLEEQNLELINHMLNSQLGDLHVSKSVYFFQAASPRMLDSRTRLEAVEGLHPQEVSEHCPTDGIATPLPFPGQERPVDRPEKLERDERPSSCSHSTQLQSRPPSQDLSALLYGSQTPPHQDAMHLGPMELKLLSAVGQSIPLHPFPSVHHDDLESGLKQDLDDWPSTPQLIHGKLK